ncbi:MAG: hypothetical protein KF886_20325 [Candidatus Hydrogenedentes bacterium]|nr:hypothetical protein [Candidatus Hydrogenedentota bacterium]
MRGVLIIVIVPLALAAGGSVRAATLGIDVSRATISPDGIVAPVVLALPGGESVAAFQIDVTYDADAWRFLKAEAGEVASRAEKSAQAHERRPGVVRVVVVGFNRNELGGGEVARLFFAREGGAGASGAVRLDGAVLSDPFGNPVAVTLTSDVLVVDGDKAIAVASGAARAVSTGSGPAWIIRYRALLFAVFVVGITMALARSRPRRRKGRAR